MLLVSNSQKRKCTYFGFAPTSLVINGQFQLLPCDFPVRGAHIDLFLSLRQQVHSYPVGAKTTQLVVHQTLSNPYASNTLKIVLHVIALFFLVLATSTSSRHLGDPQVRHFDN
jgi:hypothetical protein